MTLSACSDTGLFSSQRPVDARHAKIRRPRQSRSQGGEGGPYPSRETRVPPPRRFLLSSDVEPNSPDFLLDTPHFCHTHFHDVVFIQICQFCASRVAKNHIFLSAGNLLWLVDMSKCVLAAADPAGKTHDAPRPLSWLRRWHLSHTQPHHSAPSALQSSCPPPKPCPCAAFGLATAYGPGPRVIFGRQGHGMPTNGNRGAV